MVGIIDSCIHYPLGSRIKVGNSYGTVKYVGEVTGYVGTWLGIEWDVQQRGKHNGTVDGTHYFHTHYPNSGSFIRPDKVGPFESLEIAIRSRYLDYTSQCMDETSIREAEQNLQAAFFEVVGMDKIARKQSKFEQLCEVSVKDCPVNMSGYLMDLRQLTNIDLSHTLIWNWDIIADMVNQIPTLVDLNLSCNRFQSPTDSQIESLEPKFRNLRRINLGNCCFKAWVDVMQTARLWPNIEALGLQENPIAELSEVNCNEIFKNLKELDLHSTKIMDFDQICKLGNIQTLAKLNLMENGIDEIKLPDCEPQAKLIIFNGLEHLNLLHNPIWNESDAFNELDKLPNLMHLSKKPYFKSNSEEMFSKTVGMISNLRSLNRATINAAERRGAEYDQWKKHALEWIEAIQQTPEALRVFYKKHRTYENLIKKYGSPAEFAPRTDHKQSKLIKLSIKNGFTGELWEKRVPRMITVQTLQGLIAKNFTSDSQMGRLIPHLSYVDARHPELIVQLDNVSKTLDFFSVQDKDTVIVSQWK